MKPALDRVTCGGTPGAVALEERLVKTHREQARHYERALAIVAERGALDSVVSDSNWAHQLNAVLADIAALDAAMTADKQAWRRSGQAPGPELAALLEHLAETIAALTAAVNRHAADLEARQNRLMPEIDELIQSQRMLQAYGKYGERQAHARNPS